MTNGVVSNLKQSNSIVVALSFMTPARFLTEGFYRRFVKNIPDLTDKGVNINQDIILKQLDFHYGDNVCLIICLAWCIVLPILNIIVINIKNTNKRL